MQMQAHKQKQKQRQRQKQKLALSLSRQEERTTNATAKLVQKQNVPKLRSHAPPERRSLSAVRPCPAYSSHA